MRFLRSNDVKKHLSRTIPPFTNTTPEKIQPVQEPAPSPQEDLLSVPKAVDSLEDIRRM
jgi:hypothetical protein